MSELQTGTESFEPNWTIYRPRSVEEFTYNPNIPMPPDYIPGDVIFSDPIVNWSGVIFFNIRHKNYPLTAIQIQIVTDPWRENHIARVFHMAQDPFKAEVFHQIPSAPPFTLPVQLIDEIYDNILMPFMLAEEVIDDALSRYFNTYPNKDVDRARFIE